LRRRLAEVAAQARRRLFIPSLALCGDNAAMIGAAAFAEWDAGNLADVSLNAYAYSV
jgi:N6-L-threonylcarbamoyladenine synthase